jgi:hypothetical protein
MPQTDVVNSDVVVCNDADAAATADDGEDSDETIIDCFPRSVSSIASACARACNVSVGITRIIPEDGDDTETGNDDGDVDGGDDDIDDAEDDTAGYGG